MLEYLPSPIRSRPRKLIQITLVAAGCGLGASCSSDDTTEQKSGTGGSGGDAAVEAQADSALDTAADSPPDSGSKGTLGAACTSDADCGADGSVCLKATDSAWPATGSIAGNGPAGGYCSIDCSDYYDGTSAVDPCAALGGICYLRWCLEACSFGTDDAGNKCHGRTDVACSTVPAKTGFSQTPACYPICSPSSDCGPGRACDPATSRCMDATSVHTGQPDGAACASTADAGYPGCSQCVGSSISVAGIVPDGGDPPRICATRCVYGTGFDCGPMEACLWLPSGHGKGDLGYCAQLCDDVSECHDTVHEVSCDQSQQASLGHGYCDVTGLSATDGGSDAALDVATD